jgi:hypothetical protein
MDVVMHTYIVWRHFWEVTTQLIQDWPSFIEAENQVPCSQETARWTYFTSWNIISLNFGLILSSPMRHVFLLRPFASDFFRRKFCIPLFDTSYFAPFKDVNSRVGYNFWCCSRNSKWDTGWTVRDSNPTGGKRFVYSPNPWNRLWGPLSLLFRGYRHQAPRLKFCGVVLLLLPYAGMPWISAAFTFTFVVWAAGWMIRGSNPVRRKISVSSPQRPNQLWDLPSLLLDGRRRSFLWE